VQLCTEKVGHSVLEHFPDVRKTIPMPKGAEKEIKAYRAFETIQGVHKHSLILL
jgi:hypothetical protein